MTLLRLSLFGFDGQAPRALGFPTLGYGGLARRSSVFGAEAG
jgi:hypothetical protein